MTISQRLISKIYKHKDITYSILIDLQSNNFKYLTHNEDYILFGKIAHKVIDG